MRLATCFHLIATCLISLTSSRCIHVCLSALQMGREEPAVSMDSSGKIIWAKHNEVQQAVLGKVGAFHD